MKKVTYQTEDGTKRYAKGHLYINENKAIVLCTKDNNLFLIGVFLVSATETKGCGDMANVELKQRHTVTQYTEFHGTITLEN